ncbi:MAG: metallophosphoesterase [Gammaproteobacteria bacterium]|nr:metallophosphoesterase [Gammaproteobacteria bacterium]
MQEHAAEHTKDGSSLWLLHITDNHLFADPSESRYGISSVDSLRRVLASASDTRQPDLVVNTGDIANDQTLEVYEMYVSIVREFIASPMIATPGNHDLTKPFDEVLPRDPITMKHWHILGVDSHIDDVVGGFISQDEMGRVKEELRTNELPTLLIGHHPANEIGCAWIDEHRISNGDQFLTELEPFSHVKAYLSGHVHQRFDAYVNDLLLMTTPSTCWQFKTGSDSFAVDDLPPGWRWLELRADGKINTHVERLDSA